jgi:hypothetical protein
MGIPFTFWKNMQKLAKIECILIGEDCKKQPYFDMKDAKIECFLI